MDANAVIVEGRIPLLQWGECQDRSYEKADRVYRVVTDVIDEGGMVNATAYSVPALGPAMLQGMPTVEAVTRVTVVWSSLIRVGEKPFMEERLFVVDSSFFDLFSYRSRVKHSR